jgi:NAD(P)-dependent dehydrogenase (short-subunit alcohol dehydrogenase family)
VTINFLPTEQSDADEVRNIVDSTMGSRLFTIPDDLRNETFYGHLIGEAVDSIRGPDILLNNAPRTNIESPNVTSISSEVFQRTIDTNVLAPVYFTRSAVPFMVSGSSMIFTASCSVENPRYQAAHYASTKAFVTTYSRALLEGLMLQHEIRINAVAPEIACTPFIPTQGQTSAIANAGAAALPIERMAQHVEISRLYVGLVDNAQTHVNGASREV